MERVALELDATTRMKFSKTNGKTLINIYFVSKDAYCSLILQLIRLQKGQE